jgi:hypothetical protein
MKCNQCKQYWVGESAHIMGEECHYFVNIELPENKTHKIAALAVKLQGLVLDCAVFEDAAWDN